MNLFTLKGKGRGKHIGKRYAAGIWCWDCRVPCYVEINAFPGSRNLDACPKCGTPIDLEQVRYNPAMREFGFDRSTPRKHTGIDGASGFIWQVGKYGLGDTVEAVKEAVRRKRYVVTEYGEKWTIKQFWEIFADVIEEKAMEGEFS